MKKSDWTMIIFVAIVTGFVAFMSTRSIIGDEQKPSETVKTTILFSDVVAKPDQYIFRVSGDSDTDGAINPAVPITTGSGTTSSNGDSSNVNCAVTLKSTMELAEQAAEKGTANFDSIKTKEEGIKKVESETEKWNNEVKNCESLSVDEQTDLQTRWRNFAEKNVQAIEEHFKNDDIQ